MEMPGDGITQSPATGMPGTDMPTTQTNPPAPENPDTSAAA